MTQSFNRNLRIWTRLYRALFALAAIAPCGMAAVLALLVYPRGSAAAFYGWPATDAVTEFAGFAVSAGVVVALVLAYLKKPRALLAAVTLGVALRTLLAVALLPGLVPYSDFAQVWQIATGTASEQTVLYKSFFPEWCNYVAAVRLLVGGGLTYGGLVLASVALGLVVVGEVYLLTRIVTSKREVGFLAAAIYALMPSQVIYALIPTPDMLSIVLLLGAACLLAWQLTRAFDARGFAGAVLLAGLLIGVGSSFKPIGLVLAIAYAMALALKYLASAPMGGTCIGRAALSAVVVLGLAAGTPQLARVVSSEVLDIQIARSATASYLCIGLNTEGEGQIHVGSKARFYNSLRMSGVDEDDAAARTFDMLWWDWVENAADLPRLFLKKVVWAWQDDMSPAHMLIENSVEEEGLSALAQAVLGGMDTMGGALSQGFYLVTISLAAIGAMREARSREWERHSGALPILALFIVGFFCLLLLSEAQSRYKSNVLPYIAVFSALGVSTVIDVWGNRRLLASAIAERFMAMRSSRAGMVLVKRVDVPWACVTFATLAYMFVPLAIFFFGWTRWYIALPCPAAFAFVALRFLGSVESHSGGGISLSFWQLAIVAAIAFVTGWVCGWLGNVAQSGGGLVQAQCGPSRPDARVLARVLPPCGGMTRRCSLTTSGSIWSPPSPRSWPSPRSNPRERLSWHSIRCTTPRNGVSSWVPWNRSASMRGCTTKALTSWPCPEPSATPATSTRTMRRTISLSCASRGNRRPRIGNSELAAGVFMEMEW